MADLSESVSRNQSSPLTGTILTTILLLSALIYSFFKFRNAAICIKWGQRFASLRDALAGLGIAVVLFISFLSLVAGIELSRTGSNFAAILAIAILCASLILHLLTKSVVIQNQPTRSPLKNSALNLLGRSILPATEALTDEIRHSISNILQFLIGDWLTGRWQRRVLLPIAGVGTAILAVAAGIQTIVTPELDGMNAGSVLTIFGISIVFAISVPATSTWVVLALATGRPRVFASLKRLGECAGAGTAGGLFVGCLSFYYLHFIATSAVPSSQATVAAFVNLSILGAVIGYVAGLFIVLFDIVSSTNVPILGTLAVPTLLSIATLVTNSVASPKSVLTQLIEGLEYTDIKSEWARQLVVAKTDVLTDFITDGWYTASIFIISGIFAITNLRQLYPSNRDRSIENQIERVPMESSDHSRYDTKPGG
ncbi:MULTISPECIES: hypothetical protein [Rhodococcus]|uniref:Integral membrane protein n=1 Tax=Rhodococcus qingshengii JCM 15477 TaxID=1303681 RepID=A0AB38R7C9_RHOSG|nr:MULTISPECIES: hypothetical protein [Rhodococcus]UPU40846.1 hypothetical protein M0639_17370 [Rhodococcus qingshengii JCM 15477]